LGTSVFAFHVNHALLATLHQPIIQQLTLTV
jgi:hypothetical protein